MQDMPLQNSLRSMTLPTTKIISNWETRHTEKIDLKAFFKLEWVSMLFCEAAAIFKALALVN